MKSGIYKITNIVNKKIYIGQSVNLKSRLRGQLYNLRSGNHINTYLQRSFNKYKQNNFLFEVIEECKKEELDGREVFWISFFDSTNHKVGYNMESGGNKFKNHHKLTIKKMVDSTRGTNNILLKNQVEDIKVALSKGISSTIISKSYNVHNSTISKIALLANWSYVRIDLNDKLEHLYGDEATRERITKNEEEVRALFNMGCRKEEIVEKTRLSTRKIYKILGGDIAKRNQDDAKEKAELVEREFLNDVPEDETLKKYDISVCQYRKYVKDARDNQMQRLHGEIHLLKVQGFLNKEIAEKLNIHRTTVTEHLKERTKKCRRRQVPYTKNLEEKIISALNEGASQREVSRDLEISRATVKRIITKLGIEVTTERKDITGRHHQAARKVVQIDSQGDIIEVYGFITEAAKKFNVSHSNIIACCKGTTKTSGGYKWMYLEEYEKSKSAK